MERILQVIFMISYFIPLLCKAVYPIILTNCEEGRRTTQVSLTCPTGYTIVVTEGICVPVTACGAFDKSLADTCTGYKTADWGSYCLQRNPCAIGCTGSTIDCSGDQSYAYADYDCVWAGTGEPPIQETTPALAPTTLPSDVNIFQRCQRTPIDKRIRCDSGEEIEILWGYCTFHEDCDAGDHLPHCHVNQTSLYIGRCNGDMKCKVQCGGGNRPDNCINDIIQQKRIDVGYLCNANKPFTTLTNPQTTEDPSMEETTPTVPTTDELISDTTPSQPSTQHTMTSQTLTNGTQTTEMRNMTATQKPLEEILTACFDNATEGESSAKPYRPLSFSTPSGTETDRLAVSFYSPFLQTKPVKVAIEAFQDPKEGCDTSPSKPSNTSASTPDNESTGSSLSLNSVVNVTVYCYNGAPLYLKEGEYVDVVFPAKIDFDNEIPVCTSMKQDEIGWDWTTEGCKAVYSNYTHVTCRCDHLSAIALQRGPKGFKVDGINAVILLILEKTLGFISIIGVLVMLVVFATLGVKGSQLTKIQLNMAVSSLAGHATFLFGMKATGNLLVCAIIAAGLQYLYTVYALWLVIQTAVLLNTCYLHGKPRESNLGELKVPEKSITEPIRLTRVFLLVWAGPLLLVGLLYKEIPYGFGTPESCWLVETENVYIIFISLITLALLINFGLAICTVVYLIKMDDNCTEEIDGYTEWAEKLRNRISLCLSSSLVLSLVLVMAWASHALLVFRSILAFDYLFIIFNMIQGILVFVFYCPMNPEVRAALFRTGNPDEDEKKNEDDEQKN